MRQWLKQKDDIFRVLLLAAAWSACLPAQRQEVAVGIKEPEGAQEAEECVKCHLKVNPAVVAAFQASTMGRRGVQNERVYEEVKKQRAPKEKEERRKGFLVRNGQITCVLCHGDNHSTITETRGRVANAVCAGCHDTVDKEYEKGGGHSPDPPEKYWESALAVPEFRRVPPAVLQLSRDSVFSQQGATAPPYFDPDPESEKTGLIHRNGCDSCHTRHRFDVAEARRPESCQTCHGRAGNSVFDAYLQSKHGSIYRSEGSNWNWKLSLPEALTQGELAAPTCATCHMVQAERYGDVTITHKMSGKGVWGRGLQAALAQGDQAAEAGYKAFFQQFRQQSDAKRKAMILVCRNCHSEKFAADYLNACDQVKLASDLLVLQARAILEGLARDGLLPSSVAALMGRYQATGGVQKGAGEPAPLQAIERTFLDMALRENVRTSLAAFHQSPGDILWEGFARLQKSLDQIQEMERQRRGTAVRKAQE